jgi:monoamine oxidase
MNRRAFLAAAAGAVLAPAVIPQRVIIAGGGLAGLSCAYELRKRGFDVVVLEGQGRPGDRVQTLREGLDPELTAEAGATRIPDTHHLTLSYVRELGLTPEPFKAGDLADVVHLHGQNYVLANGPEPDWPLQLRPDERRRGRKALAGRYLADPLKAAKGGESSPRAPEAILAMDRFTIREYLTQQGVSPAAIELIALGADTTISIALLLLVEFNEQVTRGYFHIRGGNDQLPAALAKGLGRAIRYGRGVRSIGQDDRSAWAVIEHAAITRPFRATTLFPPSRSQSPGTCSLTPVFRPKSSALSGSRNIFPLIKCSFKCRSSSGRPRARADSPYRSVV